MVKTRERLLTMAMDLIEDTTGCSPENTLAMASLAQACVMLAKEMREGENVVVQQAKRTSKA